MLKLCLCLVYIVSIVISHPSVSVSTMLQVFVSTSYNVINTEFDDIVKPTGLSKTLFILDCSTRYFDHNVHNNEVFTKRDLTSSRILPLQ